MKIINTFNDLLKISESKNKSFADIFQKQEAKLLEKEISIVREMMLNNLNAMKECINNGLNSNELTMSGLSGNDSKKIRERYKNIEKLPIDPIFGKIISNAIAIMEENLRMGKIVACPTAGSCGIVPSVIFAYSEKFNISTDKQIDSLLIAGGIGKLISKKVALAGAVAGCQAECGVASAMSAAALTNIMEGSNSQILNASALALKNTLGLTCDPVAGLVEIPCIKRNGFLAIHAVVASEMALSGIKSAIPLDEVVDSMKQTGILMSPLLKESSQGGLATTETGLKIASRLEENWKNMI